MALRDEEDRSHLDLEDTLVELVEDDEKTEVDLLTPFLFSERIAAILADARLQQIDPETGELYPWWVINLRGEIEFSPSRFDPHAPHEPRGKTFHIGTNPPEVFESPFDLRNLRFIDPATVMNALSSLCAAAETNTHVPLHVYIGTGGTIAMKKIDGSLKPVLTAEWIAHYAVKPSDALYISAGIEFPTAIDSSQMEIDYIADIAIAMSWLYRELQKAGLCQRFAGFFVTHGTDTAMQSLTYLSFMLGPRCPFNVMYIVSQRTIEMDGSDALINMRFAHQAMRKLMQPGSPRGVHSVCAGGRRARLCQRADFEKGF